MTPSIHMNTQIFKFHPFDLNNLNFREVGQMKTVSRVHKAPIFHNSLCHNSSTCTKHIQNQVGSLVSIFISDGEDSSNEYTTR